MTKKRNTGPRQRAPYIRVKTDLSLTFEQRFWSHVDIGGPDDCWPWLASCKPSGYGQVKDANAKTHPCLVPFDQLPRDQQFKDRLFRTIVHAVEDTQ